MILPVGAGHRALASFAERQYQSLRRPARRLMELAIARLPFVLSLNAGFSVGSSLSVRHVRGLLVSYSTTGVATTTGDATAQISGANRRCRDLAALGTVERLRMQSCHLLTGDLY